MSRILPLHVIVDASMGQTINKLATAEEAFMNVVKQCSAKKLVRGGSKWSIDITHIKRSELIKELAKYGKYVPHEERKDIFFYVIECGYEKIKYTIRPSSGAPTISIHIPENGGAVEYALRFLLGE